MYNIFNNCFMENNSFIEIKQPKNQKSRKMIYLYSILMWNFLDKEVIIYLRNAINIQYPEILHSFFFFCAVCLKKQRTYKKY